MGYRLEESIKFENGKTYICNDRMRDIVYECDLDGEENHESLASEEYAEVIYDKITDTGRWSEYHECVFKLKDKYFMTFYSQGSTEMQDESPYEYDGNWIEVDEVEPKEVTVIKYVPVQK